MRTFTEERKFWLGKLKDMGVKAPSKMYPSRAHDDYKDGMIDRMKSHVIELAQMQDYQRRYGQEV